MLTDHKTYTYTYMLYHHSFGDNYIINTSVYASLIWLNYLKELV